MVVKVSKPEINIREKISELDKPSGIAGEAMLRAETPQEQFNLIGAGRKNMIINGENKVSQRGDYTSATAVSSDTYYIDRWKAYESGASVTLTHKQDQSLPDGSVSHTQRYDVTVAGTGYTGAQQALEEALTVGRRYTISAWVKSNDPDMNLFASAGHQRSFHSGSGEWEKLSITWRETGQGNSYGIISYTQSGSQPMSVGNFVEFTQVQLELGEVATPFEHRSYGEELALCQRYFERYYPAAQMQVYNESNVANHKWIRIRHTQTMRTSPSLVGHSGIVNKSAGVLGTITGITRQSGTVNVISIRVAFNASQGTSNALYHFDPTAAVAYLDFDAEL